MNDQENALLENAINDVKDIYEYLMEMCLTKSQTDMLLYLDKITRIRLKLEIVKHSVNLPFD